MKYDLIVIGGGPAGMMAAGRAGELGARVLLLEKNNNLGRKLLICGKGRCNITNATFDLREMIAVYGEKGKFLYSSLNNFGVEDVVHFFESRGLETKVERGQRIFPVSDKSIDVLNIMLDYLKSSKVDISVNSQVKKVIKSDKKIDKVILYTGEEVSAKNYLIATGGKSYPITGSTGDAYLWLTNLGHKIIKPEPALSPVLISDDFVSSLEGLSLKNVEISVFARNKKIDSRFGEALFTVNGMSGPIIIDMSKKIRENMSGELELRIDFKPSLDFKKLDERILRDFKVNATKNFRNTLKELLPNKLIDVFIKILEIEGHKKVSAISKEERKNLLNLLKNFRLRVKSVVGFEKAIITSGGVDLKEVDPKTMRSKLLDNLFLVGEVLDLDGPTGGFNLQICWSSGYAAGGSIAEAK